MGANDQADFNEEGIDLPVPSSGPAIGGRILLWRDFRAQHGARRAYALNWAVDAAESQLQDLPRHHSPLRT